MHIIQCNNPPSCVPGRYVLYLRLSHYISQRRLNAAVDMAHVVSTVVTGTKRIARPRPYVPCHCRRAFHPRLHDYLPVVKTHRYARQHTTNRATHCPRFFSLFLGAISSLIPVLGDEC